ncbi:MAG TPA: hypothetical protein VL043_11905 [Protaetiibacter sp.]|jgi:hypothetical protein|nr:hypothetical protein [Protaetiibacter sp.]
MVQLGQHAPPIHAIAHISDTHLLGGGRPLYDAVDTDAHVERALAQLERSGANPEARRARAVRIYSHGGGAHSRS